jgi:hypothetical protein
VSSESLNRNHNKKERHDREPKTGAKDEDADVVEKKELRKERRSGAACTKSERTKPPQSARTRARITL